MTTDISAFGIRVQIFASSTFPTGITVTQFADDGDSLDVPQQQIADKAMGVNGDLITWSKANPLNLTCTKKTDSYAAFFFINSK